MPELPDVEVFRQYLDSTSLHQHVQKIITIDSSILWKIRPAKFSKALKGRQLSGTVRHGKYVFAELNHDNFLGFHFGMSGSLKYFKDKAETPEHTRMLIRFSNSYHLAYVSVRKLGKLFVVKDVNTFVKGQQLGPDALALGFETFQSTFQDRRSSLKTALMDQQAIAGLGNIYVDEILFQAGVRPTRKCMQLSEKEWENVFRTMRNVLNAVIKKRAKPERFPSSYLTPHRNAGERCPKCNENLKRVKIGGRTTYYCPSHQN